MSVITISRQFGSGGDEVANWICQNAGYSMFDKHIMVLAAREAGFSEHEILDYSEESYKIRSLFERIFGLNRPIAQISVWKEDLDGVRTHELLDLDEAQAVDIVRNAVLMAYDIGDFVVVGRGGQVILRDKPGVLHVRIDAPLEQRLQYVRDQFRSNQRNFSNLLEERRTAQDVIASHDLASADYLERIYQVDWDDPFLYDLTVNMDRLKCDQVGQMIVDMAKKMVMDTIPTMV